MHTRSRDASLVEERVQELDVVACGSEEDGELAGRQHLTDEVHESSELLILSVCGGGQGRHR